ncbi:hypothetical protein [Rhizobium alvei]|uniref:Uncharacterized protein n=1 Tax=Rhizobium alvei TaxID=1132659 RepID=A0ABT8YFH9_9HYPH|nr:hypothetical protein [Rhizobium alvei]MDO6962464.1 hypothetical protein [Rhizobium alvei]
MHILLRVAFYFRRKNISSRIAKMKYDAIISMVANAGQADKQAIAFIAIFEPAQLTAAKAAT